MQDDEKISARVYEIWLGEGMPDGKHLLHWELACQSTEEMDRNGEASAAAATSGGSKAGDHAGHELGSLA